MKTYNKLVRDKIPEIIKGKGQRAFIHTARDIEYGKKLKQKLVEEIGEFCEDYKEEELADVFEIIEAICDYEKINLSDVRRIQKKKFKERGGFKKRIILEKS